MAHDSEVHELVATLTAELAEAQVMLAERARFERQAMAGKAQDESPAAKALRHSAHRYHTAKAENKEAAKQALYQAAIAFADGIA